jgi:hypothetical protein
MPHGVRAYLVLTFLANRTEKKLLKLASHTAAITFALCKTNASKSQYASALAGFGIDRGRETLLIGWPENQMLDERFGREDGSIAIPSPPISCVHLILLFLW